MRKSINKIFSVLLGTALAVSPVMSATPVFADGEGSYTITYDANGTNAAFDNGESLNEIKVSDTITNKITTRSDTVDEDGNKIADKTLAPLSEDSEVLLVEEKVTKDDKTYEYMTSSIKGTWQVGDLYGFDIVDESGKTLLGDSVKPKKKNTFDIKDAGANTKLKLTKEEDPEDTENDYFGHYVEATGTYVQIESGEVKTPARPGYIFTGWSTKKDSYSAWDGSEKDATLYAQWTPVSIEISFVDSETGEAVSGITAAMESGSYSKQQTSNSSGVVKFDASKNDLELDKEYTVTIKDSGEYVSSGNIGTVKFTQDGPVVSGFEEAASDGTLYKATVSLAKEKQDVDDENQNYTIEYDLDGGAVSGTNPTKYTKAETPITLINPTKPGYTFAGWTGTGLSTASTSVTIPEGETGNRSYKATWKKNADSGSGSNSGSNSGTNSGSGSNTNSGSNSGSSSSSSSDSNTDENTATGSLYLKNVTEGTGANLDKKFKFTITLTNNGTAVAGTYKASGVSGNKITFKNGKATVKLANNEDVTIEGIPVGYVVSIDQTAAKGYTTKPSSRHASGTMIDGKLTATFTNTKSSDSSSTSDTTDSTATDITFKHITAGDGADKDKKFVYTLTITNNGSPLTGSYSYAGTSTGTVAFSSEGKISFSMKDSQTLTIKGLPTGASYTVVKGETNDGYTLTKSVEDGKITKDLSITLTETKGTGSSSDSSNSDSSSSSSSDSKEKGDTAEALSDVATGDQRPIVPLVAAMCAAVAIVAVVASRAKKNGKEEKAAK